jgi:RNA polymerase sigma factor (sigma-70 family)
MSGISVLLDPEMAIKEYMPLINARAKSFYRSSLKRRYEFQDLVSFAMEAVWKATKKYVPGEVTFGQYAKVAIDRKLIELKTSDSSKQNIKNTLSYDIMYAHGEDDRWLHDDEFLSKDPDPYGELVRTRLRKKLRSGLDSLPAPERNLLTEYALGDQDTDIAKRMSISKQRVGQLKKKSFGHLYKLMGVKSGEGLYN